MEGREGTEGQSHKEEDREGGSGTGERAQAPLAIGREGSIRIYVQGPPSSYSYATADGACLPT